MGTGQRMMADLAFQIIMIKRSPAMRLSVNYIFLFNNRLKPCIAVGTISVGDNDIGDIHMVVIRDFREFISLFQGRIPVIGSIGFNILMRASAIRLGRCSRLCGASDQDIRNPIFLAVDMGDAALIDGGRQLVAAVEGSLANGSDTGGQVDVRHIDAFPEGAAADGGYGIRKDKARQLIAFVEG